MIYYKNEVKSYLLKYLKGRLAYKFLNQKYPDHRISHKKSYKNMKKLESYSYSKTISHLDLRERKTFSSIPSLNLS